MIQPSVTINLAWTDNAANEDGYRVERSADGTTFSEIVTLAVGSKAYSSTGLAANKTYWFRVRAVNAAGTSNYSNTTSAKTPRK